MKKITIFTATYNREKLLFRLYKSIIKQKKLEDVEWIIVDDDSTDNTSNLVKEEILPSNLLDVHYYKQVHGGKHRAINKGLEVCKGEYFMIVDSDDYLVENALECVFQWISDVQSLNYLAGVSGLRQDPSGKIIGNIAIKDRQFIEASNLERGKYGLNADMQEIYRTDILKKYKFPEFENEFFLTEAVCWDAIAADGYQIRWYNSPICVCEYIEDGLTKNGANGRIGHIQNFVGYSYYVKQCLRVKEKKEVIYEIKEFNSTCKDKGIKLKQRGVILDMDKKNYLLWIMLWVPFYRVRNKIIHK